MTTPQSVNWRTLPNSTSTPDVRGVTSSLTALNSPVNLRGHLVELRGDCQARVLPYKPVSEGLTVDGPSVRSESCYVAVHS